MLPRAGVAAERIEEVLHMENSIHDKEVTMDESLKDVEGVVRFEKVSFKYPGADENALEEIDFAASPGNNSDHRKYGMRQIHADPTDSTFL